MTSPPAPTSIIPPAMDVDHSRGGEGRPIVLVHPIGASLAFWDALVPCLRGHAPFLRYDLPGHGGRAAASAPLRLDALAEDLLAQADEHGLGPFDVCGVSLGGMVALAAGALAGDRVRRITVCATAARVAPPPGGWDGRAQAALQGGMAPLAGPMVERMFSAAFRASGDPMVGTLRAVFEAMDPRGYAAACGVLGDADLTSLLPRVAAPVLVVSGAQDPLCPPEKAQALADALPVAQHVSMDSGHFPPVERPEALARVLLAHRTGG